MNQITSIEELDRISGQCQKDMEDKIAGADDKRHIVLCGGTGCLSSNSKEIAAKFKELLAKKGLNEKATITLPSLPLPPWLSRIKSPRLRKLLS